MRAITLGLTCNNACIFCAQGDLSAQRRDFSGARDEIAKVEAGDVVAFVGGEPTLDDDLPALVQSVHARGARRIIVQTNGRRFAYRAYAHALREASDKLVIDVSLHGSTGPMHDYHTATPGSFRQTALGVRHARAEGIDVGISTVVTRSNHRHLVEMVTLARGLGAKAIKFVLAQRFGRAVQAADRIFAPAQLVEPQLARAVREAARLGLDWVVGDRSSRPIVRDGFAGLGEVELPEAFVVARGEGSTGSRTRLPVMQQFRTVDQGVV